MPDAFSRAYKYVTERKLFGKPVIVTTASILLALAGLVEILMGLFLLFLGLVSTLIPSLRFGGIIFTISGIGSLVVSAVSFIAARGLWKLKHYAGRVGVTAGIIGLILGLIGYQEFGKIVATLNFYIIIAIVIALKSKLLKNSKGKSD